MKAPARLGLGIVGAALVALGSWVLFVERNIAIESPGFPLILAGWIGIVKAVTSKEADSEL